MRDRDYYDCGRWDTDDLKLLSKRGQPKICKQSWLVPKPWYVRLFKFITFQKPERYEPTFEDIKGALIAADKRHRATGEESL